MKLLIVIPARGGSKGIPLKNIYPINGKPLILYTLEMIGKVDFDGDIVVSTDSVEIGNVVTMVKGIEIIWRPTNISGDRASTESALLHALSIMEKERQYKYDAVMTLQVTSPLRTVQTVEACIQQFERDRSKYDAILTLTESRLDYWVKTENGKYNRLYPDAPRRRQDRMPIYIENSALYITDRNALIETKSVLGYNANGYVISEKEGIDINEKMDVLVVEELLKKDQDITEGDQL